MFFPFAVLRPLCTVATVHGSAVVPLERGWNGGFSAGPPPLQARRAGWIARVPVAGRDCRAGEGAHVNMDIARGAPAVLRDGSWMAIRQVRHRHGLASARQA
jgi:hypothetical protein